MKTIGIPMLAAAAATAAAAQPTPPLQGEPQPVMQRRPMRVEIPPVRVEGRCAAVPMSLARIIPAVEVTVAGRGPYRFAIDTGAQGHGRISRRLAEELGLETLGEVNTPAPGGTVAARPLYGAGTLGFGSVTFSGVQLLEGPMLGGAGTEFDGILGIDLFRDLTLTLDYANGVAAVSAERLAGGVPASFEIGIPAIPIEVAGRSFEVHLDTGNAAAALFLPEADARALPLSGEPVERGRARTSFGEFAVMEAPLAVPVSVGGFALPLRSVAWPPARRGGNLGSHGLAGTMLQVDRRSGRIAISAPAAPPRCPAA